MSRNASIDLDLQATRVLLAHVTNLRDHGGYPVDGGTVARGRLFRAEAVVADHDQGAQSAVLEEELDQCRALGIATIIDLRAPEECLERTSVWDRVTGGERIAVPIPEGGAGSGNDFVADLLAGRRTSFRAEDMVAFYRQVLDRRAPEIGRAVSLVAAHSDRPVLVHCASGKDRTGLVVALVLTALGASADVVARDYAFTGVVRSERIEQLVATMERAGVSGEACRALFETPESAMRAALAHLEEEYGSAVAYLQGPAGVTTERLALLRERLVTSESD
jgi:protein-tyrosine phosphatase